MLGGAAASAVGTAAGDEAYEYAKEIINNWSCKVDNVADYDLEYNYERLIEQAKKLYACRDDILTQAKTKLVTQAYEAWISRVMKSEEEVRDLKTKYKKEKGKKWTLSQHLIGSSKSRTDRSQSMKCKKLHNLWLEGKYEIEKVVEKLPERVIIMHGPKSEDQIFLDSTVEEILGHLRDKTVKRIGLWGMSGIGKTTIMQSLNNNEDTAKMFDIAIWVTVSKDWNLEKLQHKIADRLKLNMEGITDPNEIAQLICRDLKSKRCLLLLDEVREVLDLPLIGMCDSEKDSKVVVATRNYHVCCDMETDLEINVQRLSEADAWKMFKVKVGRNVNLPGIEQIAKLVVSECAGLPLLIDKVASMFRRKDNLHLWSDGLKSLQRWPSIKIQGIDELIENLKFCYEDLDDEVKKACFLYVAIYPEDFEIYIDYLLECWIAEGFIHDTSEFRVARDKGHSILEELISVSLLEKSAKMNHVRMNKVIRNMALNISSRSCNFKMLVKPREGLQEAPNELEWQQANRISLMDNKLCTLPEMPDCNELSTLLLQRNQDLKVIPESFFGCMQNLRVLDLHGTGITSLPSSISCLKCLKALYLHSCSCLMELRYLEGLEHLEVLDIRDTSLNHFPIQIGRLNQLKCLRMSLSNFGMRHSSDVEYCRNVFSSLLLLEELLIDVDPNNQSWEVTIKAISEGLTKLTHLTSLSICFPTVDCLKSFISTSQLWKDFRFTFQFSVGYHDTTLYKILDCFEYQIRKCLKFANGEGVDPIISDVLLETDAFELIGHKGTSRLSDFGIESINKMRGCLIEGCNDIETIVDGNIVKGSALICLEKMFINNVPNLKSIWEGPVHNGSLSQLTTLTLCKCLKLKKIFSCGMIKQLSQLQHLKVEDCPEIEEIIAESENDGLKPDALPRLKMLELSNLPRVKSIWTSDSLKWPSLEKIKIYMCQMLTKLPFNSENAINLRCIEAHQTWWSALACQDDATEQRLKSLWGDMWGAAASGIGKAAASAVGTAAGDEAYIYGKKYGKEIINNLSCKVDNEADYDLEDNYKRLIEQAKKLYACRDDILTQAKTKLVTQVYEAWISRVMKCEEEVRELESKYKKEKGKKRTWSQRLIGSSKSHTDLSQSMAEKCKKLHNLWVEGKSEIGIVVEKLPERVIIMHGPKSEDQIFLDSTVEEILGHLRDKTVKRIGLWGMSGIGKTTIMQSLNNNEDTAKMFDIAIWVTVSKDWNLEKLQHKIADRLKLNMEGITDPNEIAQLICRDLKSKRCLLLLDEVREVLDLPLIGMCDSEKDSKVVVATRNYHVCCDMETDLEINVQRLSEADAWKMFKVKVGRNVNLPGIEQIAKLVVSECAGLPLLIDKVASMFRRKDNLHLWSDGLRSLQRWPSIKIQGIDELIENLKFCYEDLDDEVKKACFLYVAIYPEDFEIYIDYLLECWIAEGFIHDTSEFRVARDKGHSILEELISVSLLEKSAKMNHVRMNKVIRNMALNISSRSCNFKMLVKPREGLQEAPNELEWQQANRISLMDNKLCTLPEMPDCNELSTLLLQRNQDLKVIPESFFGCMQNLRVLDLHGTGITSLPSSISCLKCLKALYLHSCSCLMELRYLEGLEHLEVLDIRDTSLNHFPIQIGRLNQLKCLRMSLSNFGMRHSSDVEYCRNVFSSLLLLEELLIDVDPNNQSWEVTIKAISEGLTKLTHLTSLSICFPTVDCLKSFISTSQLWKDFRFTFQFSVGYHDTTLYKILDCFEYQIRKCLKFANGEGVDPIISDVLLETDAFELIGHKGTSRLSDFGIESINKMRGCLIEGCNDIETIVDGNIVKGSALICLEKMFINNVPNLKSIWEGPVHNGSLSQLTTLTLCKCLKLKKIFSCGMIKQLSQLQHLKVEDCPEIEEIIAESENDGLKPDALPRLKMLELSNLPRVKSIWTSDSLKWPSLEKIKIYMCQMLTKLPFNSENAINLRCIEAHQTWWSALACQDDATEQRLKSLWGGRSEGQTMLDPQGVWLDDKAVEMNQMTSNSSVEMKFEIKEIGYEDSQRQSEFIQDEEMEQGISTLKPQAVDMTSNSSERTKFEIEEIVNEASQKELEFTQDEEMEQAISTLKPVEVVSDVDALKMPKSSGQMEFQIKDNEMEPETDRPEESQKFLMKGGLGLTEPPKDEDWENAKVMNLMDNELSVLPENPRCPKLSALFLQRNYKLRMISPQFFDYMPALQILNLSRTSIKSLPDSISRLFSLKRLFLNDCHRFMRLSPKVGELKQLEVLDLEGTEIMDLPREIKKLTNLTCFEVSFYGYKSDGRKATQSSGMVPCGVVSALSNLEELNIDVNPDAEQWDACVEAIVAEVCSLKNLNMLKFYFPRMELLSHIQCKIPALLYFQFIVGRHVKRIISQVPHDVEFELERWERCLKYINGMSVPRDIRKVLQHATAFFLDRHATVKKLSDFGIQNMEKLKCLVVGECNKLQVIIDEADGYKEDDSNENVFESYGTEKFVLGSLEYLYIYHMRSLRSIWEGSVQQNSLSLLKSLTLCTCPKLTTIFTQGLLNNLCKLEELNVEDCASINSIVCFDISVEHKATSFLPNLKKISLHDMPGLVSIFGGLHIAPKLEWLSFYKCPNLKNPLIDEVSTQNLKRIKGLKSWWDALEWINGRPGYLDKIFVPINIWDC